MAVKNLYGEVATQAFKSLFAQGEFAHGVGLAIAAGQGDLTAGALLIRGADDTYTYAAATDVVAGKYFAVLGEDIATGAAGGTDTVPSTAVCYFEGVFMPDKVTVKSGTLNAAALAALRDQGITFKSYVKANGTASDTITIA